MSFTCICLDPLQFANKCDQSIGNTALKLNVSKSDARVLFLDSFYSKMKPYNTFDTGVDSRVITFSLLDS